MGAYGRPMFWANPRNRTTGEIESIGFWAGAATEEIVVEGVARIYFAADGNMVFPRGIVYSSGSTIQMTELMMGPLGAPARALLRGYNPRQAHAEIHIRFYRNNGIPVGIARAWRGRIEETPMSTDGGWGRVPSVVRIVLAPASRMGSKVLAHVRGDAVYRLNQDDEIGQYMAIGGTIATAWGQKDIKK